MHLHAKLQTCFESFKRRQWIAPYIPCLGHHHRQQHITTQRNRPGQKLSLPDRDQSCTHLVYDTVITNTEFLHCWTVPEKINVAPLTAGATLQEVNVNMLLLKMELLLFVTRRCCCSCCFVLLLGFVVVVVLQNIKGQRTYRLAWIRNMKQETRGWFEFQDLYEYISLMFYLRSEGVLGILNRSAFYTCLPSFLSWTAMTIKGEIQHTPSTPSTCRKENSERQHF